MAAHPDNQQQVVPKVDPKVVAQMHKVILQQVCICDAPIPRVHLQRRDASFALCCLYMLGQCQDLLVCVCVCAAKAVLISAASGVVHHLLQTCQLNDRISATTACKAKAA